MLKIIFAKNDIENSVWTIEHVSAVQTADIVFLVLSKIYFRWKKVDLDVYEKTVELNGLDQGFLKLGSPKHFYGSLLKSINLNFYRNYI